MYKEKKLQKYKLTKYTRELERFTNRVVNFFQKDKSYSHDDFEIFIEKIFKPLENIEKIKLTNHYLIELEKFVEVVANLPQSRKNMEELRKDILYQANQLRKKKRKKREKKDKHKKRMLEDEIKKY